MADQPKIPPRKPARGLEAFELSEDFDARLASMVRSPGPWANTPEVERPPTAPSRPVSYGALLSDEEIERRMGRSGEETAAAPPPAPPVRKAPPPKIQTAEDLEQAQLDFYEKRLEEIIEAYSADDLENAIKRSANVVHYILTEFQFEIEEEKRHKIVRKMAKILGLPRPQPGDEKPFEKPKAPFRGERLKSRVESLYRKHIRRYSALRQEFKERMATEEWHRYEEQMAAEKQKAEERRREKEKRLAERSAAISEEKLAQIEAELDDMFVSVAASHGKAAELLQFGYEPPENPATPAAPVEGAAPVAEPVEKKDARELTPQEIIARNNARRRQRGLRGGGETPE